MAHSSIDSGELIRAVNDLSKERRVNKDVLFSAIEAALNPESTDYYYYALGKDGKHHFSTTLKEHNAFLNSDQYAGN